MGASHCASCGIESQEHVENEPADMIREQPKSISKAQIKMLPGLPRQESVMSHASNVDASMQQLAWVNRGLEHLWPQLDQLAAFIANGKVLPLIKQKVKAKSDKIIDVNFSKFTLGKAPVVLGPLQTSDQKFSAVRIRCFVQYISDMEIELAAETQVGSIKCGIKDFTIAGQVVFHLRPFIHAAEGTGGMSMCFLNPPDIDFGFSGAAQIANLPGLKGIVLNAVADVLGERVVLPNQVSQLMGYEDFKLYPIAVQSPVPVGILEVTLVRARLDSSGSVAPLTGSEEQSGRSSIIARVADLGKIVTRSVHHATEWVDEGLALLAGKSVHKYLKMKLGQSEWTQELSEKGRSFTFTVHDPEQHLQISLWDRDFTSADDMIAQATLENIKQVVETSGEEIALADVEENDAHDVSCAVTLKAQWFHRKERLELGGRCLVVGRIRELRQEGFGLKDKKIAVRMKLGDQEKQTPAAAYMRGVDDNKHVTPVLSRIRENMMKSGHSESAIEKALDLSPIALTRLALNCSIYFMVPVDDVDALSLEISLVELRSSEDRKDIEEVVAGKTEMKLSLVSAANNKALPGPIVFDGPLGKIEAQVHLNINGLLSAELSEIDMASIVENADD